MKRLIAIIIVCAIVLVACAPGEKRDEYEQKKEDKVIEVEYAELSDPSLLQYIEDSIYSDLERELGEDKYIIEDISVTYISKEYLEEIEYNSKENIYFGYSLSEIDAQFEGTRYVFSLGEDGTTVIKEFEKYDDTYDQIIRNVAIGTGVILICVTVSVVSGGLGASTVSMIFSTSAKTGTALALSSGTFSGVTAGVVNQIETGNVEESIKIASLEGSEEFKWGAICGVISGGTGAALKLHKPTKSISSARESEVRSGKIYGGKEQVSYLKGKQVPLGTEHSSRPDIVREIDGVLEAIEVKNYDLDNSNSRYNLYNILKKQIADRVENLPEGSRQRVVLDVKGRKYSEELLDSVTERIKTVCMSYYPDLPVDIMY